uniref:EGF-like domain-containing protein n=2 Tax=Odontella aurita TaxID=265563 RepID=A0A7S4N5P9_9STRA|mmetsp:Transcript_48561/g.146466  ORF Transcript_48561/g.146466 Transcript_48561/m.146466 type:complete len:365 (+) Transcript_48561:198-1292(+)|eukprot:CAMPEP_0113560230 /NCGR_PEP_ID=MMETSP0015_2-20120614/19318_1 /TAXON_ID=2838 /ORGANISM="Odontella" /LENGTH=364 /DNA_ID=CAMNT_0000461917 /DNA_START=134 /DNA_END=1228 /DNA_ORIENTATION=+ /assembly_acc=CAM_ASM_000160
MNLQGLVLFAAAALIRAALAAEDTGTPADCSLAAKCKHESVCTAGPADFGSIAKYPYDSPIPFLDEISREGEHCECPEGRTGVTCRHAYEVCDETTGFACFHGSKCVNIGSPQNSSAVDEEYSWGCDCMGAATYYAGRHCEHHRTNVCKGRHRGADEREDILSEEEPWFCTNGGLCLEDEGNELRKCHCSDAWIGPRCEFQKGSKDGIEYEEALRDSCSLDCKNGGECAFGSPEQLNGEGSDGNDDASVFLKISQNRGMHCQCLEGYKGDFCEISSTLSKPQLVTCTTRSSSNFIVTTASIAGVCALVPLCLMALIFFKRRRRGSGAMHVEKSSQKDDCIQTLDSQTDSSEDRFPEEDMELIII